MSLERFIYVGGPEVFRHGGILDTGCGVREVRRKVLNAAIIVGYALLYVRSECAAERFGS